MHYESILTRNIGTASGLVLDRLQPDTGVKASTVGESAHNSLQGQSIALGPYGEAAIAARKGQNRPLPWMLSSRRVSPRLLAIHLRRVGQGICTIRGFCVPQAGPQTLTKSVGKRPTGRKGRHAGRPS
jgi:hypothetical protein